MRVLLSTLSHLYTVFILRGGGDILLACIPPVNRSLKINDKNIS